jgi:hypothetical protein
MESHEEFKPDPDVKYSASQIPEGAQLDAWLDERFQWAKTDMGYTYSGPCPRCGHPIDKELRKDGIFPFRVGESGAADARERFSAIREAPSTTKVCGPPRASAWRCTTCSRRPGCTLRSTLSK